MLRLVFATTFSLLLVLMFLACSGSGGAPEAVNSANCVAKFVIPPDISSFLDYVEAKRDLQGGIRFEGKMHLPGGSKIMLNLHRLGNKKILGQDKMAPLTDSGKFVSTVFTDQGKPYKEGKYRITLTVYFNGPWNQPNHVIEFAGINGTKLPKNLSVPLDREFPDSGRRIEIEKIVIVPPLSPEVIAIQAVKNAKLVVPEHGRANDTVGFIVSWYMRGKEQKEIGWSAVLSDKRTWEVTLQYLINDEKHEAKWEFNPGTHKVGYLNPEAKVFSWLPSE